MDFSLYSSDNVFILSPATAAAKAWCAKNLAYAASSLAWDNKALIEPRHVAKLRADLAADGLTAA